MSKNILVQVEVPIQLFYLSKSEKLPALYSVAGRGLLWWGVVFCGWAWSVVPLQGRRTHHPQPRPAGLKSALGPAVLL